MDLKALDLLLKIKIGEHLRGMLGVAVDVRAQVRGDVAQIVEELIKTQQRLIKKHAPAGDPPQEQFQILIANLAALRSLDDHRVARALHRLVQAAHQRERQDHVPVLRALVKTAQKIGDRPDESRVVAQLGPAGLRGRFGHAVVVVPAKQTITTKQNRPDPSIGGRLYRTAGEVVAITLLAKQSSNN